MRVHWLQHAEHEDLGCIAPWLAARGHVVTATRLQRGELPPKPGEFDWLIVMGGPMNIYQHAAHPWLVAEKQAIRAALNVGKRVLGICLGAQLIADQLGGPVVKNAELEVGWHPISLAAAGRSDAAFKGFPEQFTAFHWHGDSFALPLGSQPLMHSAACGNQAFTHGAKVAGIQFHLEVTAANARDWFATERPPPGRHVQAPEAILAALPNFAENNRLMIKLLENLEAAA
ncbi:MAG: type 1 glutamine amidotransferase [Pseudomonadota bacterium]